MQRRVLALTLGSTIAALACGQGADEDAADTTPVVGAYELAISRHHQAPQPSGAARVEITPSQIRLDGRTVLTIERGLVPAAELSDYVVTKLRDALVRTPGRSQAALWVDANVPYLTLAHVLKTLEASSLRDVSFAVRRGGTGIETGWMRLTRWRVVPPGNEPIAFTTRPLPWSAFTSHWREMYASCNAGQHIDCDGAPASPAEGGELEVQLWTRGQGMKVTFVQVNAPVVEAVVPSGPALLEGVRAAPIPTEPEAPPPIAEGGFNFRHQESIAAESALSNTVQPVCGVQSCRVTLTADATGMSMRVISMLGAFYANGFTEPEIAFRIPELQ